MLRRKRNLQGTRNKKSKKPQPEIIIPGTMKDNPQLYCTKTPAITAPRTLPKFVCEFQIPSIKPLFELCPIQLPTAATHAGHPVD